MCRRISYISSDGKSCLAMEIQCASYLLNLSILWFFPSDLKAKGKQEGKQDELEDLQTKSLGLHEMFFFYFFTFLRLECPIQKPNLPHKSTSGLMLLRQNLQHSRPCKVAEEIGGFPNHVFFDVFSWIQRGRIC